MPSKPSRTTKRIYRKRVSKSPCRGKRADTCKKSVGCKRAKGKTRAFCRKSKNTKSNKFASFRITRRRN